MTAIGAAHHPRMHAAPLPALAARLPGLVAWIVARDGQLAPDVRTADRADLVRRAAGGDQEAFERLVRPAGDRLLAIARKILRDSDAAEDAVQLAIIQAWRELPRLREPDRFDAWLTKLLVNSCYQEARRARRNLAHVERVATADGGGEPATADDAEALADRLLIERAFLALSPAHRAIVVLHHYADLPLSEVAAIAGIAPGTARSRLHYALRALRAALEAADRPIVEEFPR